MPVTVFSGLPGAGKTAQMVAHMLECKKKFPNRPRYYMGINGLVPGIATELTQEQLENWWTALPSDSIIFLDEAQEDHLIPKDMGQPKEWVKRIRKVRHEGMDFVVTCQHPCDLSTSFRRLVDNHYHTVRKWNTKVVEKYRWGRCVENPEKESVQKSASGMPGTLPKHVFDLYTSAKSHNMKVRLPLRFWIFIFLIIATIGLVVTLPGTLHKMNHQDPAKTLEGANGELSKNAQGLADATLRVSDYPKWIRPRVDGLPWTAPAFDGRQVKAQPRVFCMAVEDGRCGCITEQGTHYDVPVKTCRLMVKNGVYDPFLDPKPDRETTPEDKRDSLAAATKPQAASPTEDRAPSQAPQSGRGVNADYVPPDYQHPLDATKGYVSSK